MEASFTSLADLAIIIVAGAFGGFIAIKSKLPSIVGYIFAGLIISIVLPAIGLNHDFNSEFVTKVAELGIALLLFAAGIEFSVNNIRAIKNLIIFGTVIQTLLVIATGFLVMQLFGLSQYEAFFIGVVAATSSTAFVLKMLEQREEISVKSSNIMIGWLVMQDILIIALFLLLKTYAPNMSGETNILEPILKSALLIIITLGFGRLVIPLIFKKIAETRSQELLLVSVIGLSIGFALLTELFGISYTLGAFLTGLALSETFLRHEIFSEIKPIRDLFSMVFFVSIGTLFKIDQLAQNILPLIGILFVVLVLKILIIFFINLFFNIHPRNAVKVGLGLSQIGEFAFLGITIGRSNGWINDGIYSLVLVATIISMSLTPFLYSYSNNLYKYVEKYFRKIAPNIYRKFFVKHLDEQSKKSMANHIIVCGYGKVGRYVAFALKIAKEDYIVIELDSNLAELAEKEKHNIIFGDATNMDILNKAAIKDAKAIVIALPEKNISQLKNVVLEIKRLNPYIEILLRSSGTIIEVEHIKGIIEPEFEASIKIVEKLEGIISQNKYDLTRRIRNFREREIKAVVG